VKTSRKQPTSRARSNAHGVNAPQPFAVGDTVSLKSGSHLMTVEGVDGETVDCVWAAKDDFKSRRFSAAELERGRGPVTFIASDNPLTVEEWTAKYSDPPSDADQIAAKDRP
jgi:uncharacterized protein YodC (DUF2158 family)